VYIIILYDNNKNNIVNSYHKYDIKKINIYAS